jgi:nucleotide-binding universal stress UspA family protein
MLLIASAYYYMNRADPDCGTTFSYEHPAPGLVAIAEGLGARMIVVGSYGGSPPKGAIVGSTPHKLIQISPVPVLVVRA